MIQQDLEAKDWRAALVSLLALHYGYLRYLCRKFTEQVAENLIEYLIRMGHLPQHPKGRVLRYLQRALPFPA